MEGGLQLPALLMPTLQGGGMLRSHRRGGECLAQALSALWLSQGEGKKSSSGQLLCWERGTGSAMGEKLLQDPPVKLVRVFG